MVGLTLALGAKQRRVGRQRLIWAGGVVGAIRIGGVGIGACQGGDQILGGTGLVSGSGGRLGLLEEGHDLVLAESPWGGEGREREKAGGEIGTELIGGARGSIYSGYHLEAVYNTMRVYGGRACNSTKRLSGERNDLKAKNTGKGGSGHRSTLRSPNPRTVDQPKPAREPCWDQIRSTEYGVQS